MSDGVPAGICFTYASGEERSMLSVELSRGGGVVVRAPAAQHDNVLELEALQARDLRTALDWLGFGGADG